MAFTVLFRTSGPVPEPGMVAEWCVELGEAVEHDAAGPQPVVVAGGGSVVAEARDEHGVRVVHDGRLSEGGLVFRREVGADRRDVPLADAGAQQR